MNSDILNKRLCYFIIFLCVVGFIICQVYIAISEPYVSCYLLRQQIIFLVISVVMGIIILTCKYSNTVHKGFRKFILLFSEKIMVDFQYLHDKYFSREDQSISCDNQMGLLTPIYKPNSYYVPILKDGIDNLEVHNIALSGPYCSGKSSVIKTFQILNPKYKCLNISLANFEAKEVDEKELEYSLLQQFFYHVDVKKIPKSRFKRIGSENNIDTFISAIVVYLTVVSILGICYGEKIFDLFLNCNSPLYLILLICLFLISFFIVIYKIIILIAKWGYAKVRVLDSNVELKRDGNVSEFNKYLDEIVYLFHQTQYSVVFLEDLDRHHNIDIFAKLRELNTLLNQSGDLKRRIVFVYALSDECFKNLSERNKFFDFVIPVIPHFNRVNSALHMLKKNGPLEEINVDNEFLMDVAPFIDDYRILQSILSEYKISCELLKTNGLNNNKLLAMIIFKHRSPVEYANLQQEKGYLFEILGKKKLNILFKEKLEKQIADVKNRKQEVVDNVVNGEEELDALFLFTLVKNMPKGDFICDESGQKLSIEEFEASETVKNLKQEKCLFYDSVSNGMKKLTWELVLKLTKEFDYPKRLEQIQDSKKDKINNLLSQSFQVYEKWRNVDNIEQLTIQEICKIDSHILDDIPIVSNNEVLKFFLRRGYIEEDYYSYMTLFEEGVLTSHDNAWLMKVKKAGFINEENFDEKIDKPNEILKYLVKQDFSTDVILNFDLVKNIFQNDDNVKYRGYIIDKLKEGNVLELGFILSYLEKDDQDSCFYTSIIQNYDLLSQNVLENEFISGDKKLRFVYNVLKKSNEAELEKIKYDRSFMTFLNNQDSFFFLNEISIQSLERAFSILEPRFINFPMSEQDGLISELIIDKCYYQLNERNIRNICEFYRGNVNGYDGAIYSLVFDSGIMSLIQYVHQNINEFVEKVVLSHQKCQEKEKSFICLLNNDDLNFVLKKKLIVRNHISITVLSNVQDVSLYDYILQSRKMEANIVNIDCYYKTLKDNRIDDNLINFVNSHRDKFMMLFATRKSFMKYDYSVVLALLQSDKIKYDIIDTILKNPNYRDLWINKVATLAMTALTDILSNHMIVYSYTKFKEIMESKYDIFDVMAQYYADEMIPDLRRFDFSIKDLIRLAGYATNSFDFSKIDSVIAEKIQQHIISHEDMEEIRKFLRTYPKSKTQNTSGAFRLNYTSYLNKDDDHYFNDISFYKNNMKKDL